MRLSGAPAALGRQADLAMSNSKHPTLIIQDAIKDLDQRFTSGNEVPVERAWISRAQWEELRPALQLYLKEHNDYVQLRAQVRLMGVGT